MDLTPRATTTTETAPAPRRDRRKLLSIAVLLLVLAGGAVVVTKFLTSSLDYYCNVDEVGHKDGCEVGRRLRIQGTVDKNSLTAVDGVTTFKMTFNKITVPVVYDGQPGGLFQECIPVVVHGVMKNGTFEGDDIEVKHSNEYDEKNKDRINKSASESAACSQQA